MALSKRPTGGDRRFGPAGVVSGSAAFIFLWLAIPARAASPDAVAGPNQEAQAGQTVVLNGSGSSDPDGDPLTFFWQQLGGTAVALSDPNSPTPSFVAPNVDDNLIFRLTVIAGGEGDTDVTRVKVRPAPPPPPPPPVNRAPDVRAGPDQTVDSGQPVTLDGSASSDPDGDVVTYAWSQVGGTPVVLNNPNSLTPTFIAPAGPATLVFNLTGTDPQGAAATDQVIVNVRSVVPVNRPPNAAAGPNQVVQEGAAVSLNGSGSSDPDGDVLTFQWVQTAGPPVALANPNTATPSFTAPLVDTNTNLVFSLTVTDPSGASNADSITVAVTNFTPSNNAPVSNAGPDQIVDPQAQVTLSGQGSDPDGEPLTFSWTQVAGPPATLTDANQATARFVAPAVQQSVALTFRLTVSDGRGGVSSDETLVTIRGVGGAAGPGAVAIRDFIAFPNPFSPATGVTLRYTLSDVANVTLVISDTFGNLVREENFAPGTNGATAGTNTFIWDGRNGDGEAVGNGGYTLRLEAETGGGRARAKEKVAVVK